ncbi:hypothetical protein B4Q13_23530, partial [Lacticaseibacillus rhamnosus]
MSSLLATGFPYDRSRVPRAMRAFESLSSQSLAVRRAGSAALDLCYVAAARLDGYWEYIISPWDVAAGTLIVRQAGGLVTHPDGTPFNVHNGQIVASNAALHPALHPAVYKSLPSLAAASVLHATKERSLGKLGGLIHRRPGVAWLALVGTLAMAGLPPLNGFVSEWLPLQAFPFTP